MKWDQPWFRQLNPKLKCVWMYLVDRCDFAGIWHIDMDAISFYIGQKVTLDEILENFDVLNLNDGTLFIRKFFKFQYQHTKDSFIAKKRALERLTRLGLVDSKGDPLPSLGVDYPYTTPSVGGQSPDCLSISISSSSSISSSISISKSPHFDFETLYKAYPLKIGKKRGLAACKTHVKTTKDYDRLKLAIEKYTKHVSDSKIEKQYIKHFDSFMSAWEDWIEEDAGHTLPPKNPTLSLRERLIARGENVDDWE
jgi:hypothetical protein